MENRENNIYKNLITDEELNATEFLKYIKEESKRQYEECTGENFNHLTIDERQDCYLEQFNHQLKDREWECINN